MHPDKVFHLRLTNQQIAQLPFDVAKGLEESAIAAYYDRTTMSTRLVLPADIEDVVKSVLNGVVQEVGQPDKSAVKITTTSHDPITLDLTKKR